MPIIRPAHYYYLITNIHYYGVQNKRTGPNKLVNMEFYKFMYLGENHVWFGLLIESMIFM